jgi:hypothetical protein
MPSLSSIGKKRLATCDPRLQAVVNEAIKRTDFSVLCGHRGREEQEDAFERGTTRVHYPKSKHNSYPSKAVDLAPYPIDWNNLERFRDLAKIMFEEAEKLNVKLRWGGDFNMNGKPDDKFNDMPHYEIVEASK